LRGVPCQSARTGIANQHNPAYRRSRKLLRDYPVKCYWMRVNDTATRDEKIFDLHWKYNTIRHLEIPSCSRNEHHAVTVQELREDANRVLETRLILYNSFEPSRMKTLIRTGLFFFGELNQQTMSGFGMHKDLRAANTDQLNAGLLHRLYRGFQVIDCQGDCMDPLSA
jgi:hypothetical protein